MSCDLNRDPLTDIYFCELLYASWMLPRTGRTLDALVELITLAARNLDQRSFTTSTCLNKAAVPKKVNCYSFLTFRWHVVWQKGSEVSFLKNEGQRRHVWRNLTISPCISWKKKRDQSLCSIFACRGWLSLCVSCIAFPRALSCRVILSPFSRMPVRDIIISERVGSNFCTGLGASFRI